MELHFRYQLGLVCVTLLLPVLCSSQDPFVDSRATYYSTSDGYGNPRGACGFGDYGRTVNDGSVTAVSSKLWKDGSGCGGCYQVRCKIPQYCDENGAYVVVTDSGEGDRTDFILSPRAFSKLGRNAGASAELRKYGVVDVQYRKVPCNYAGSNIIFKIDENSKYPNYLAIVILYFPGTNDVTAVELKQAYSQEWRPLRRAYGAVFDFANPPSGELNLRIQVRGRTGVYRWLQLKTAIPSVWKPGTTYSSEIY